MIGQTIARYQILGKLGEGGMGMVYRAIDPRFGREVALKVLPSHFLHNPEFRQRFEREAKLIASLEHSAIVPVHDVGEYNGQPFLVMRLMGGGSLSDRLKRGALPLTEVTRIISHLAPGLDKAHAEGIVHRDLKPDNILFDQDNMPYITDFGIAKQIQAKSGLTATGTVMGTPQYMSPEQARGESNLSGRSDIYAFGTILFQMLTGHVPYQANTPIATALRHLTDPVPRINPADLAARCQPIIDRAMAKLPQNRYPTATALSAHLTALVNGQPSDRDAATKVVSPPPPSPNRPQATVRLQPKSSAGRQRFLSSRLLKWAGVGGMAAVVGLLACMVLFILAWSIISPTDEPPPAAIAGESTAIEAREAPEATPSATPPAVASDVDISGKWTGTLTLPSGNSPQHFKLYMVLSQTGNEVEGLSKIEYLNNSEYYGIMSLRGTVSNGVFYFEEIGVNEQNLAPGKIWCIKSGELRISDSSSGQIGLQGPLEAPGNCPPGDASLEWSGPLSE